MFFNKFVFLIISVFYFIFINPSLNKKITHIKEFFPLIENYKKAEKSKYQNAINQEISRDDKFNFHFYINIMAYNIQFVRKEEPESLETDKIEELIKFYRDKNYDYSLFQVSNDEDENKLKIVENEMLYKRRINMFLSK